MTFLELTRLHKVAWCDPAGGNNPLVAKQYGLSRSAIVVLGQDELERIFILSHWAQRCPPDQLVNRIFETQLTWKPSAFGIDSSGTQLIFAQMVQKEIRDRGLKMNLKPVALRQDKTFSIETTIQPVAANGRLFRPPENECKRLHDEWVAFPDGHYRDIMDALACAIRLLPSSLPAHMRAMERGQLRRYLERSGMAESEINRRLSQHDDLR